MQEELEPIDIRRNRVAEAKSYRRCGVMGNHIEGSLGIISYLIDDLIAIEDFKTLVDIRERAEDLISYILIALEEVSEVPVREINET